MKKGILYNIDVHTLDTKCLDLPRLKPEAIHQIIDEVLSNKNLTIIQITPVDWMSKPDCTCDMGLKTTEFFNPPKAENE